MGPTTHTTFEEIAEPLYRDIELVEDAVLEINEFEDAVNPGTSDTHYRVAATDGENYSFSGPLDSKDHETVRQGLDQALSNLEEGGRSLDDPLGETGEYLAGRR